MAAAAGQEVGVLLAPQVSLKSEIADQHSHEEEMMDTGAGIPLDGAATTADSDHDSDEREDSVVNDAAPDEEEFTPPEMAMDVWKLGWQRWSVARRRARMAQFVVKHLFENDNARWIDVTRGKFMLHDWRVLAKEWYDQKNRGSDLCDATSMLRKGLPRAFPKLREVRDEAIKDGTQYLCRVFQAPASLMKEVVRLAQAPKKPEESASSCDEPTMKREAPSSMQNTPPAKKRPSKAKASSSSAGKACSTSAKRRKQSTSTASPARKPPSPAATPASTVSPQASTNGTEGSVGVSSPPSMAGGSEGSPLFASSPEGKPADSPQVETRSLGYFSAESADTPHLSTCTLQAIPNVLMDTRKEPKMEPGALETGMVICAGEDMFAMATGQDIQGDLFDSVYPFDTINSVNQDVDLLPPLWDTSNMTEADIANIPEVVPMDSSIMADPEASPESSHASVGGASDEAMRSLQMQYLGQPQAQPAAQPAQLDQVSSSRAQLLQNQQRLELQQQQLQQEHRRQQYLLQQQVQQQQQQLRQQQQQRLLQQQQQQQQFQQQQQQQQQIEHHTRSPYLPTAQQRQYDQMVAMGLGGQQTSAGSAAVAQSVGSTTNAPASRAAQLSASGLGLGLGTPTVTTQGDQYNMAPRSCSIQGGTTFSIFSSCALELPVGPIVVIFYSQTLQRATHVETQRNNPYSIVGTIPSHPCADKVTVNIVVQGQMVMKLPFEYVDDTPLPPMDFNSGDISSGLGQIHGMLGSFLNTGSGGAGAGSGGGGGGGGGGTYGQGGQFGQYFQLLRVAAELDIRPLARMLLQLPFRGPALCKVVEDSKRIEDIARDRGSHQISSCMTALRTRYQLECAGQEYQETFNPLDLLECPSSAAAECVAAICKALTDIKQRAREQPSSPAGSSGTVTASSPVAEDETGDGISADDENSEPDIPSREPKKSKRSSVHTLSETEGGNADKRFSSPSPDTDVTMSASTGTVSSSPASPAMSSPSVSQPMTGSNIPDTLPDHRAAAAAAATKVAVAPVTAPLVLAASTNADTQSTPEQQQQIIARLQTNIFELATECDFLRQKLQKLNSRFLEADLESKGAHHAATLLKEQYEQASQRRDEAMKAMVQAKNESRRARRDAEKFEAEYMDAMRQRDEALALCDRLNAENLSTSGKPPVVPVSRDESWQQLAAQHEQEAKRLTEEHHRLQAAVQRANEARDKAVEERKVLMGGLEAAVKQGEGRHKELQDLQAMHYSMAEELRTTKDRLYEMSREHETQKEALKMARREGESAIKRGIQLQDRLRRVTEGLPSDVHEGDSLPQSEVMQSHYGEIEEERDAYSNQLEDLEQHHQELLADHDTLENNYTAVKSQCDGLQDRLHNIDTEVEEARHKRDWAIGEYHKALTERDQLRTEMDNLRLEKEQAIEERMKAVKQLDAMHRSRSSSGDLSLPRTGSAEKVSFDTTPQTIILADTDHSPASPRSHSPPSDRSPHNNGGTGRRPQRRPTMDSRRSADDSALGSLDTTTLMSGGGASHGEAAQPVEVKKEIYDMVLPPKCKDYGLVLETALFVSDILPGSLAEKEGKLACGDLVVSVNNASPVKQLSASDVRRLLKSGSSKQGPALTCLTQHSEPPSKVISKSNGSSTDDRVMPTIIPKMRTPSASSRLSSLSGISPSPSLSARVAGKIGNLSPKISRLVRTASQSSTPGSISASDLQILGREYSMREGFEPGKRSRRDSLSSQSSCSYTASASLVGSYAEDSISQISQMDAASEARQVTVRMQAGCGVGFKVQGGNCVGLFVTAVREDSLAHSLLQRGDQLLKAGDHDLLHCSLEESVNILKALDGDVVFLAQFNPGKFHYIHEPAYDSFHVRCQFDYAKVYDTELSFRRGDVLHVVNSVSSDDSYLAWRVNSDGSEVQLGAIPNMQRSLGLQEVYIKQLLNSSPDRLTPGSVSDIELEAGLKLTPYVPVERHPAALPRPVLLCGGLAREVSAYLLDKHSDRFGRCIAMSSFSTRKEMDRELAMNVLVEYTEDNGHFSSTSVEGVQEVARQNQHCLLSIKPAAVKQLSLANFQPIVIVIDASSPKDTRNGTPGEPSFQVDIDIAVDVVVRATSVQSAVDQVLMHVGQGQQQPIWCEAETQRTESLCQL